MIKKILIVCLGLLSCIGYAQDNTASPYSFYGIGIQKFKGTVANRSMGGLSIVSDSIHVNLQNPAAYGDLLITTYALGGSYSTIELENKTTSSYTDIAALDYLAIGIPAGKFGFGIGLIPYQAVGYDFSNTLSNGDQIRTSGSGGLNKVYLTTGFKINKNFNIGIDLNYNFGKIEDKALSLRSGLQLNTREINTTRLSGFGLSLGINYKGMLTEKLNISASIVSSPSFILNSENTRELASVTINTSDEEIVAERIDIDIPNTEIDRPSVLKIGSGIGESKKWFAGVEYTYTDFNDFISRNVSTSQNIEYKNGSTLSVGGYYIPKFNSLTNYFNRIVYRAGFRYEETGLHINNESIDEFGMSFGVGLPLNTLFSNVNIGIEYGQRGTTDISLVKEKFYNFSLSLSLNDKWFRKIKYN